MNGDNAGTTNGDDTGTSSRRRCSLAEKTWLQSRLPDFMRAQASKNTAHFWPEIQRDYFTKFPVLNMDNPNLTEEEKVKVSQDLQARTAVSYDFKYHISFVY